MCKIIMKLQMFYSQISQLDVVSKDSRWYIFYLVAGQASTKIRHIKKKKNVIK